MPGFRKGRAAISALAAIGLAACASLDVVQPDTCGNGVVEPAAGEDCDQTGRQTSGNACGQPVSDPSRQCRYVCARDKDTRDITIACPGGWACGVDLLCRRPASPPTWTPAAALVPQAEARSLLVADFDLDGVDDVVAVSPPTVDLHFFEASRTSVTGTTLFATNPRPTAGVLTSSSDPKIHYRPSLLMDVSNGLGVFTGQADRTLDSAVYISVSFPQGHFRVNAYQVDQKTPGMLYGPTGFYSYNEQGLASFTPPSALKNLALFGPAQVREGAAVTGRFTTSKTLPCGQLALAFNDRTKPTMPQGHVRVYAACNATPQIADVFLPAGIAVCPGPLEGKAGGCQPLHLDDVNLDGWADLVVTGADNQLYVAYSDFKEGFWPTPAPSPGPANTFSSAYASLPGTPPLALGDINGDCVLDLVDASAIYLGKGSAACDNLGTAQAPASFTAVAGPPDFHTWTEARIADLNGDGYPDVAVGSSAYAGLTVYRGTGKGLLNPVDIVTSGPTKNMSVGDFDGDNVLDLAYAQIGDLVAGSTYTEDTVFVSFGATSGPPSAPYQIGAVTGVAQIVPALEAGINPDLIENAFVVSWAGSAGATTTDVSLFPGNSSRQMVAPYFLLGNGGSQNIDGPRRSAVGSFTGRPGFEDVAVFARSELGCATATSCPSRLWLLPTLGDAAIEPAGAMDANAPKASSLPMGSAFEGAEDGLLANIGPRTGSGPDELVIAVPSTTAKQTSLATTAASGGTFMSLGAIEDIKGFEIGSQKVTGAIDAAMRGMYVSGRTHRDLVLASPTDGIVVLLWDEAKQAFDVAGAKRKTLADLRGLQCGYAKIGRSGIGIAALNKPPSPPAPPSKQPVVVVVPEGAYRIDYDGTELVATCLGVGGGFAVGTGDFDGDGIEDIAVSQPSGLALYYGDAVRAGGADRSAQ